MIQVLIFLLILLWLLGYISIQTLPDLNIILLYINGRPITLWNILTLLLIGWAIGILPSPFREVASIFLILWILSLLGIIAVAGLSNLLLIAFIAGFVVYALSK